MFNDFIETHSIKVSAIVPEVRIEADYSHTIRKSVTIFVGYGSNPPSYSGTYYYNDGLYSGTLKESYSERRPGGGVGDRLYVWYVTYTGYVTSNSGYPTNNLILIK